jgi:hypothetical protein
MTYTEQIIEKSIEGGFGDLIDKTHEIVKIVIHDDDIKVFVYSEDVRFVHHYDYSFKAMLLRPSFWKCLERALHWDGEVVVEVQDDGENIREHSYLYPKWQWHWHKFIDHLAEGKDYESYFKKLLT